jgi:hypothetical protein
MLLPRFFAWLDRALRGVPDAGPLELSPVVARPPEPQRLHPAAALLSVDGGGQFLLCAAERLTLGHLRAGRADLGFLADVGPEHAALVRADTLADGPGWRIEPCGAERVAVEGAPVGPAGRRLAAGELVRLGENLEFRLRFPDPASASAVLELLHGAECAGARHIVLFARGLGGRVRIGASRARHVPVPGLAFELELRWEGHELELASEEPLAGALEGERGRLPFPPPARLALTVGAPRGAHPPFGLSLEPFLRP